MRRITAIALLPAVALALTACGGSSTGVTAGGESAATLSPSSDDTAGSTSGGSTAVGAGDMGEEMFGTAADVGGPYGELRDGVWEIGPAGSVEFRVTGPNSLELVGVVVAEGWQIVEQEVESDKIDVDFRRGPVEFQFEVEIDDNLLELEIDQDIDPANPGTFALGEAGTVAVSVENGRIVLGETAIGDGWNEVKREIDDDDIELDFRRDGNGFFEQWELYADEDNGALDIEVDYEIEGRFAG
jgi:hypothetical protein